MGKRRRTKGTGTVRVLSDGRADAEYVAKNLDGSPRRLYKRLPSKEDAERWLLRVRHEEAEKRLLHADSDRLTVAAYRAARQAQGRRMEQARVERALAVPPSLRTEADWSAIAYSRLPGGTASRCG